MNKILTSLLLLGIVSGCQSLNTSPDDPNYQTIVAKDSRNVKDAARIATRVYILTIDDAADRKKTAQDVHDVSVVIKEVVSQNKIPVEQIRTYTLDYVKKSNIKKKDAVVLLIDSITVIIQERLDEKDISLLPADQKSSALKSLILSAVDGIIEATDYYTVSLEHPESNNENG